jgi:nitrogen fixation protein NifU and related proteins
MAFDDLYQEIILDHYRNPRNSADLVHISDENVHENPSCGDSVKIHAVVKEGVVEKLEFDGKGCAISMASASMMTDLLAGKTVDEAKQVIARFQKIMRGEGEPTELEAWGDLAALAGVIDFPLRVKCATLSWHALDVTLS